jgi:ribulose-5-phosphate 4-epimerase/fuculose-1-phosphate aldolase
MIEEKIRQSMVFFARKVYYRYLVRDTGGNLSARISEQEMLVTASGLSLGDTKKLSDQS